MRFERIREEGCFFQILQQRIRSPLRSKPLQHLFESLPFLLLDVGRDFDSLQGAKVPGTSSPFPLTLSSNRALRSIPTSWSAVCTCSPWTRSRARRWTWSSTRQCARAARTAWASSRTSVDSLYAKFQQSHKRLALSLHASVEDALAQQQGQYSPEVRVPSLHCPVSNKHVYNHQSIIHSFIQ